MIAVLMAALAVGSPSCNDQVTIVTVPPGQVAAAEWRLERGGPVGPATVSVFVQSVCRLPAVEASSVSSGAQPQVANGCRP